MDKYLPIFIALCLAALATGSNADSSVARRSTLAGATTPPGWWHTLKVKGGKFCGLRDFPPIPDGYGSSRLYCVSKAYDHGWLWRIAKVSGSGAPSSGDEVYLTVRNPMLPFCRIDKTTVVCGVAESKASKFVLEKETGSGAVNLTADSFYLKAGTKYCGLTGKGHSQQLKCDRAKSAATVFQFPASSFVSVRLVSPVTNNSCGGDFYGQFGSPAFVSCGNYFPGMAINLTVALGNPGAPVIVSGANVTFKTYDDLYTYQVSTWRVDSNKKVYLEENDTTSSGAQWFNILRTNVLPTNTGLTNGTIVAIQSALTGRFCGFSSAANSFLVCDNPGPIASLPRGHTFAYVINS